jgi:tetratricopeptide (TPR) repeat protein/tRNA A-37 threonylcarbamoyl transferase component Bud32
VLEESSHRAQRIGIEALKRRPSDREAFVAQECQGDSELRGEVETLLAGHLSAGSAPTIPLTSDALETQAKPTPQRRIEMLLMPGQILTNRFEIIRFISAGGMGEVYEAEDLILRERIALKTIRPDIAASEQAVERFKNEIYLARKVTHTNVCRIFDLAQDRNLARGDILFLTMELLAGETLAHRLYAGGRLHTDEALPLVLQMSAALNAAHEAGIVHRDFKSGNVILVPASGETPRAVVTDFGLARGREGESGSRQGLTHVGAVVGTPAYMAPEQLEGGKITPATDIYALGVVMYEMLTGTFPFTGDNPWAVASQRLKEKAPSPRIHLATLDARWEKAILRCLERRPEDRFASAAEVASFLRGEAVGVGRREKRRNLVVAGCVIAILAGAGAGYLLLSKRSESRRAVAVLEFKNITSRPEAAWVATGLAEGLRSELAAAGKFRTISGEEVADFKRDSGFKNFDSLSKQTLTRIHRLGVDLVVTGSYTDLGKDSDGRILLNVAIQDAAKGETIDSLSADGTEKDISALISHTGARLRAKLGVSELSPEKETSLAIAQPNAEAMPLYAEGLDDLRNYKATKARELFQNAIAVDPNHPFVHAALARTWSVLGYDERAKEEAKKALDLSAKLSLEDRLSIEGQYREMASDWRGAVESYSELYKHFPDNVEYGVRLAHAQSSGGKAPAALDTLAALHKLPPPRGDDPSIDLEMAETADSIGDYKKAEAAALSAIGRAKARNTRLLEARALIWACSASRKLGDPGKARAQCEEAVRINSNLGDKLGTARAENGLAMIDFDQGDVAQALKRLEEAFQISSEIGDNRDMAGALNNTAMLLSGKGNLTEARKKYEQALAIQVEIGFKTEQANTLGNLADLARQEGDLTRAKQVYGEAVAVARQSGDRQSLARGLNNLGGLLFQTGNLQGAADSYQEALSLRTQMGAKAQIAATLDNLGELYLARGDFDRADKAYRDALKLQQEAGDKSWIASSKVGLANVLIERGRGEEAEVLVKEALEEFHAESDLEDDVLCHIALARCLLVRQRYADAQKEVRLAVQEGAAVHDPSIKMALQTVRAQSLAATGGDADRRSAVTDLRTAIADAGPSGAVEALLKARLTLAEIESKGGMRSSARAAVSKVQDEATGSGFGLIAQKAQSVKARL